MDRLGFPKSIAARFEHSKRGRQTSVLTGDVIPTREAGGIRSDFQADLATLKSFDENPQYDLALGRPGHLVLSGKGLEQWQRSGNTVLEGSESLQAEFKQEGSEVSISESSPQAQSYTHAVSDQDRLDLYEAVVEGETTVFSSYLLSTSFNLVEQAVKGPNGFRRPSQKPEARTVGYSPSVSPEPRERKSESGSTNWGRVATGFSGESRLKAIEARYGEMPFTVRLMARTDSTSDELAGEVERVLRQRGDLREVDSYDGIFLR